mmetsp:Transcript_53387/g.134071  ORF Transcript_53387/g.134071 Transcript_53387/m.134071 type:complete len:391 (-) Transcript_53387:62-1234(-)
MREFEILFLLGNAYPNVPRSKLAAIADACACLSVWDFQNPLLQVEGVPIGVRNMLEAWALEKAACMKIVISCQSGDSTRGVEAIGSRDAVVDTSGNSVNDKKKAALPPFTMPTFSGGKLADKYTLGEELGRGFFGVVFKGTVKASSAAVAIKQLTKKDVSSTFLDNVFREIAVLKSLDHGDVVKFVDAFQGEEHIHVVLDFVAGKTLEVWLGEDRRSKTEETVAPLVLKLIAAMKYLHSQRIAHNDLKPDNVMVTEDGIRVLDFGSAVQLSNEHPKLQTIRGFLNIQAPEACLLCTQGCPQDHGYDEKADIWQFGLVVHKVLTGREPPYPRENPIPSIIDAESPIPRHSSMDAQEFVGMCLKKDPAHRSSWDQLAGHYFVADPIETPLQV